ncbi:MAG: pilus assembly protein PilM [Lachnospiraceae bacterium]|nr:pilus assembly protein PilM [Lachnospiraceae bacterium]
MAKHVLSIEIGQKVTKVAEIDYLKKNPHVYRAVTFATPDEVVNDGFIRDRDVLARAMKEQLANAGMREKSVVFSIACSKIVTREVDMPNVKENKIGDLVKATAQDYFPVDLSEYSVAHSVLERTKEGKDTSFKVMLLAAPDSLVENYYNFAESMGFNIMSLDYFGNGSMQVLKNEIVLSYCACIQISGSTSMINFMNEGQQIMQRTIPMGVFNIAQAIVDNEDNSVDSLDVACQMLTRDRLLCRTLDYEGLEEVESARLTSDQYSQAVEGQAIRKVATDATGDLIMSVIRVLDFFRSQHPDVALTSIYITGMGVKVVGIDELFASEIDVPINRMEHLVNTTFPKRYADELYNQTEYIAVIGAAMAPVGFKSKVKESAGKNVNLQAFQMFAILAAVVAVAFTGFCAIRFFTEKGKNAELTTAKNTLSSVQAIYDENAEVTTIETNMTKMDSSTKLKTEYIAQIINKLEEIIPSTTYVEGLNFAGDEMNLSLVSSSDISVARILMNLRNVKVTNEDGSEVAPLSNLTMQGVTHDEDDDKWIYSLTCTMGELNELETVFPATGAAAGASSSAVSTEE